MKKTAIAPANIAFVKYWGKTDEKMTLPKNSSISMNLDCLHTTTTVEFGPQYDEDKVEIAFDSNQFIEVDGSKKDRVVDQLHRLRVYAGKQDYARVVSRNNFPAGVGIASSASAFCALTAAAMAALECEVSPKELSILTRLGGSGSAVRSVLDGFVEWKKGTGNDTSYAVQLVDEHYWELYDLVLVVSSDEKKVSSLEGHSSVDTCPYYPARLSELPKRIQKVKQAILAKDIDVLGEESEKDAISLHCIAMTSSPPIYYWSGATMEIIHHVLELRKKGVAVYFTIDAGPNVHLICEKENVDKVQSFFKKQPYVQVVYVSKAGKGVRQSSSHLF